MNHAVLLISCPDVKGITAAVTNFVYENGGNIVHADQHIDEQTQTFFMRIEWSLEGFAIAKGDIREAFKPIAQKFRMTWDFCLRDQKPKMAIFVSKHLHCLHDLLYRYSAGQLFCDISLIISNHPDAKSLAKGNKIKFVEISKDKSSKESQEAKELDILKKEGIDLIILARYHQIFTADFVDKYPHKIINIHHSFLPAFAGGRPYQQAYEKGVKIIGATGHYVTENLDEGPIIEQDTVRISHRDSVADLIRKGEDLERIVLSRAVLWHLEGRILTYNNKTVIFD